MLKRRLNSFVKDFLLYSRIPLVFGRMQHFFRFSNNTIGLSKWIRMWNKTIPYNDFFKARRNYNKRESLYEYVCRKENMKNEKILYLEFGVCGGGSFRWWTSQLQNADSRFYGFDTFEGLPEKWGFFKKGDMAALVPDLNDNRTFFVKGLFQQTLFNFIDKNILPDKENCCKKIIHLDADLFSSTLFVLTSLAPYLNKDDIIFFDEFNVPNHEYAAWEIFTSSFYVDYEVLGAVNNFYQIAIKFKGYKNSFE